MRKILVFGNSGSGKTTLTSQLCAAEGLAHLDLDSLAWLATDPPQRAPLETSAEKIQLFAQQNEAWVIEGCYSDLLEIAAPQASEIIFMNLPVAACVENARRRPWEPHKYESKEAQDQNLEMLIGWIEQYDERDDVFSSRAHRAFYDQFPGQKRMLTDNERSPS